MSKSTSSHKNLRRFVSLSLAVIFIGSFSYIGVHNYNASHAATGGNIYIDPASATFAPDSRIILRVMEDSHTAAVTAVHFSLEYDASKLQYVSLNEGDLGTKLQTSTENPGIIRVARGSLAGSPLSGEHAVVSLTFKVVANSGMAAVNMEADNSFQVSGSQNITQSVRGGEYSIGTGAVSSGGNTTQQDEQTPVTLSYVAAHYSNYIAASIFGMAIVALVLWKLVLPRLIVPPAIYHSVDGYNGYVGDASKQISHAGRNFEAPEPAVIAPLNTNPEAVIAPGQIAAAQQTEQLSMQNPQTVTSDTQDKP